MLRTRLLDPPRRARTRARAMRDPRAHVDARYWGHRSWAGAQARCACTVLTQSEEQGICARAGDERAPEEGEVVEKHNNFMNHSPAPTPHAYARACAPRSRRTCHRAREVRSK